LFITRLLAPGFAIGMDTLKELDLSRCTKISDAGLRHIVTIQSLEKLHLSGTRLTDNGVKLISSLTNLSFLDLGGIRITDKTLRSLQVQFHDVPPFSFSQGVWAITSVTNQTRNISVVFEVK
jgi:Leucine-rich repeat (LRR) protein